MNATLIDTHVADAQARLLEQYKGRPAILAFVASFAQHVQQLEQALFAVPASFQVQAAQGAQLDVVGSQVGVSRNGLDDDQYRALIQGTIAQNNGTATVESLLSIIRGLFQTSSVFLKRPDTAHRAPQVGPATLSISIGDPAIPSSILPIVESSLKAALGAGVSLAYLGQFQAQATSFSFAGNQPWVGGFGSVSNSAQGAALGGLLVNNPTS